MAYMSKEKIQEIRRELKETFPEIKFSVKNHHHSTVEVSIMSAPYNWPETYHTLNYYHLEDSEYENKDILKLLLIKGWKKYPLTTKLKFEREGTKMKEYDIAKFLGVSDGR